MSRPASAALTMLATRLHGREDLRWEQIPDPTPGPGEVRLKVAHNGLCGSDLHMYFHYRPTPPFTLGHEFSGVVDAIGPGVTHITPGAHVAVRPFQTCGHCHACARRLDHLCATPSVLGCAAANGGGLAEYCVARADMVFPLPAGVSLAHGALVEPMAVSYNGVLRGDAQPGMSVVIFGAGPIGVGVLLTLHALGVDDIVVVEPSASRRATISTLGARNVLDPTSEDVAATIKAHTRDRGADVVFECAGVQSSFNQALAIAGARGRVVLLAAYEQELTWNPSMTIMPREIEVRAALAYEPGVYEAVIDLIAAGHYPLSGWVEHIPWPAVVDQGLQPLRRGERMKVLVDVTT